MMQISKKVEAAKKLSEPQLNNRLNNALTKSHEPDEAKRSIVFRILWTPDGQTILILSSFYDAYVETKATEANMEKNRFLENKLCDY